MSCNLQTLYSFILPLFSFTRHMATIKAIISYFSLDILSTSSDVDTASETIRQILIFSKDCDVFIIKYGS